MTAITVDVPRVTEEQALLLVAHHLSLAASYYEAITTDRDKIIAAMLDAMDTPRAEAAMHFIDVLDDYYKGLD